MADLIHIGLSGLRGQPDQPVVYRAETLQTSTLGYSWPNRCAGPRGEPSFQRL